MFFNYSKTNLHTDESGSTFWLSIKQSNDPLTQLPCINSSSVLLRSFVCIIQNLNIKNYSVPMWTKPENKP